MSVRIELINNSPLTTAQREVPGRKLLPRFLVITIPLCVTVLSGSPPFTKSLFFFSFFFFFFFSCVRLLIAKEAQINDKLSNFNFDDWIMMLWIWIKLLIEPNINERLIIYDPCLISISIKSFCVPIMTPYTFAAEKKWCYFRYFSFVFFLHLNIYNSVKPDYNEGSHSVSLDRSVITILKKRSVHWRAVECPDCFTAEE